MAFRVDLNRYFTGEERDRAVRSLQQYEQSFTGRWFDRLAAASDPNRFTAQDIVAVEMLSISIRPETIAWLLEDADGLLATELRSVPPDATIQAPDAEALLGVDGPMRRLWGLLGSQKGLKQGRTTKSKLLAVKRPALVPVFDSVVSAALMPNPRANDWVLWRATLAGAVGAGLADQATSAAKDAGSKISSVLRIIDVVVWMRHHGWRWSPALEDYGTVPPPR